MSSLKKQISEKVDYILSHNEDVEFLSRLNEDLAEYIKTGDKGQGLGSLRQDFSEQEIKSFEKTYQRALREENFSSNAEVKMKLWEKIERFIGKSKPNTIKIGF